MKLSHKIFFHIIFLFYFINTYPISLQNNNLKRIVLNQEKTEILLDSKNYNYVKIELFFSEKLNYVTTFNQYNPHKESNTYDYSKNQTDLIIKSEYNLGKSQVILYQKDKVNNDILLSIFLKDKKVNNNKNNFVYIKYKVSNDIDGQNYTKDNEYISFETNSGNNNETNDEITDEEVDKNREKNKTMLYIILAGFIAIVLITCIAVICYLKCHDITVEETIEEDKDYSNIGGITPNKSGSDNNDDDRSADK